MALGRIGSVRSYSRVGCLRSWVISFLEKWSLPRGSLTAAAGDRTRLIGPLRISILSGVGPPEGHYLGSLLVDDHHLDIRRHHLLVDHLQQL